MRILLVLLLACTPAWAQMAKLIKDAGIVAE